MARYGRYQNKRTGLYNQRSHDTRRGNTRTFFRVKATPPKNASRTYRLKRALINKMTPSFVHRARKIKYLFKGPKHQRKYSYRWNQRGYLRKKGC